MRTHPFARQGRDFIVSPSADGRRIDVVVRRRTKGAPELGCSGSPIGLQQAIGLQQGCSRPPGKPVACLPQVRLACALFCRVDTFTCNSKMPLKTRHSLQERIDLESPAAIRTDVRAACCTAVCAACSVCCLRAVWAALLHALLCTLDSFVLRVAG